MTQEYSCRLFPGLIQLGLMTAGHFPYLRRMNVWWITLVPFIYSCSMMKSEQQEKILQAWVGRPVGELEAHEYFSRLSLKYKVMQGKTEIRNYEEKGKYASKARSQGLGSGMGLPSEICQNIFTIQNKVIQKYEMKESCLTNKNKLPQSR